MWLQFEIRSEKHFAVFHIVDVGTDLVHAVGGLDGHDIVALWHTKDTEYKVNGFVAAVAEKDLRGFHPLQRGYGLLQLFLQRVGITVERHVVRTLVGIEKRVRGFAVILITGRAVGLESPNVGADQLLERFHIIGLCDST